MPVSLMGVLWSIPDHRRQESKRFDLATVLLHAILAMIARADSDRQMPEFIRIHRQRLDEAFWLEPPYSSSYTGTGRRLILHGVDAEPSEAAVRRHVAGLPSRSRIGSQL
jgi:hypothetical protein